MKRKDLQPPLHQYLRTKGVLKVLLEGGGKTRRSRDPRPISASPNIKLQRTRNQIISFNSYDDFGRLFFWMV